MKKKRKYQSLNKKKKHIPKQRNYKKMGGAESAEKLSTLTSVGRARCLLCFFDASESKLERLHTIGVQLISAIFHAAAPILTTGALLRTIRTLGTSRLQFAERDTFNKFNVDAWIVKELPRDYWLLIPKSYCRMLGLQADDVAADNFIGDLTSVSPTEMVFGILVNHLKTATDISPVTTKRIEDPLTDTGIFFPLSRWLEEQVFFCNKRIYDQECLDETSTTSTTSTGVMKCAPVWSFYMAGHGSMLEAVCGIPLLNFQHILQYLETEISTRFLCYFTCYEGGVTNQALYKTHNSKNPFKQIHSYTIVTAAATDATVGSQAYPFYNDFGTFVMATMATDVLVDIDSAISIIGRQVGASSARNVPLIKYAGSEWFRAIPELDKRVVVIGRIMAFSKTSDLFIVTDECDTILIYANVVPFRIMLSFREQKGWSVPTPLFISMFPGNAIHILDDIDASQMPSRRNALDWFIDDSFGLLKNLTTEKLFWIKRLTLNDKRNGIQVYTNVLVYRTDKSWTFCHDQARNEHYADYMTRCEAFSNVISKSVHILEYMEKHALTMSGVDVLNDIWANTSNESFLLVRRLDIVTKTGTISLKNVICNKPQRTIWYQSTLNEYNDHFYTFLYDDDDDDDDDDNAEELLQEKDKLTEDSYVIGLLMGAMQSSKAIQLQRQLDPQFVTQLQNSVGRQQQQQQQQQQQGIL